jgi:hypothetical protein
MLPEVLSSLLQVAIFVSVEESELLYDRVRYRIALQDSRDARHVGSAADGSVEASGKSAEVATGSKC